MELIPPAFLMVHLKQIGRVCAKVRRAKGYTQLQVAFDVGYAPENVSAFECGRNDNLRIFLWYLKHCVTPASYMEFITKIEETENDDEH